MKQEPAWNLPRLMNRCLFPITLIAFIGTAISSCTNQSGSKNLTGSDSLSITTTMLKTTIPKTYYLLLSAEDQRDRIFTSNDVKQIKFEWKEYPDNTWGLTAYGMNESGERQLSGPVDLQPVTSMSPVFNYQGLNQVRQVWKRGDLKDLLNLDTRGENVPVGEAEYRDLLFTPTEQPYLDSDNAMYFIITLYPSIVTEKAGTFAAGRQSASKPSPPAPPACTPCDDASY